MNGSLSGTNATVGCPFPCSLSPSPSRSAPLSLFGIACQREGVRVRSHRRRPSAQLPRQLRGRFLNAHCPLTRSFPEMRPVSRKMLLQNRERSRSGLVTSTRVVLAGGDIVDGGGGGPSGCLSPSLPLSPSLGCSSIVLADVGCFDGICNGWMGRRAAGGKSCSATPSPSYGILIPAWS